MYQFGPLIVLSALLLLPGCDTGADQIDNENSGAETATQPETLMLATGRIGPVHYSYDAKILTRAETELSVPLGAGETAYAVKFLPRARMANIDPDRCAAQDTSCSVGEEEGFAIALLDRPIEDYSGNAEITGSTGTAIESAEVDGVDGFTLTRDDDGATTSFTFIPINGRTLLLVDQDIDSRMEAEEALDQVRESVSF